MMNIIITLENISDNKLKNLVLLVHYLLKIELKIYR